MKLGVMGGTFDPVHLGHLIAAEEARWRLGLDLVVFVPAGQPWQKSGRRVTPTEQRVEMLRLAIASNPHFRVSLVDVERSGPSYTIDTIPGIKREYPAAGEVYFLVGLDSVMGLPSWREPEGLLDICQVVGLRRPGYSDFKLADLDKELPGASQKILLLDSLEIDISATEVRRRVAASQSIKYLVPQAVEAFIYEKGLYRLPEAQ